MEVSTRSELKFYLLSFISIVIISAAVLYPSFKLAFEDEDWRGVVLHKTEYAGSRLSTYSSPVWFMDALYTWLGPNFFPYYILAFIFRNLLSFSILVFVYTVTKDRLASFLGGLFMSVSLTGIQNTYEVMNIISYVSMTGLMIFLTAFFKTINKFSYVYLTIMGIALSLATFIASFRVYPVYIWAMIVDSIGIFMRFKKDIFKSFLIRQLVILIVFLFLYKIGIFSWYSKDALPGNKINDLSKFISDTISLITGLDFNIATNFIKGLGNIVFPSTLDKSGTISLFLGVALIITLIKVFIYGIKEKTRSIHLLVSFLFWPLLFYSLYFFIYINSGYKNSPPLPSSMRYLLPPFIGFDIALAISISLTRKIKYSNLFLGSVILLIMIHSISTYGFLSKLSKQRDGSFMIKIWRQIPQLVPESSLSSQKMNVFYFETDGSPRAIYTVDDGFIGHAIALYRIDNKSIKFDSTEITAFGKLIAPPIITYEGLITYIRKSLSENPEPDIWNRIFALRVAGDRVINIKEDVKVRVETSLNTP